MEHQLQNQILDWLNKHENYFAWRNQSQGTFRNGRWMKKVGFDLKGVSDILGIQKSTGKLLAIEVKSDKGKATMEQNAFINKVNSCGGIGLVVRNMEDVINVFL